MSLPDAASLETFSLAELREVVGRLVGEVRRLHSDNSALQAKVDAQQVTVTALRAENQALRGSAPNSANRLVAGIARKQTLVACRHVRLDA